MVDRPCAITSQSSILRTEVCIPVGRAVFLLPRSSSTVRIRAKCVAFTAPRTTCAHKPTPRRCASWPCRLLGYTTAGWNWRQSPWIGLLLCCSKAFSVCHFSFNCPPPQSVLPHRVGIQLFVSKEKLPSEPKISLPLNCYQSRFLQSIIICFVWLVVFFLQVQLIVTWPPASTHLIPTLPFLCLPPSFPFTLLHATDRWKSVSRSLKRFSTPHQLCLKHS